jgi:hypothetical protein
MVESQIENRFVSEVKKRKALCLKFISPGFMGVPDRIVLAYPGRIWFVELKRPGKVARPLQEWVHKQLRNLGFKVYVIDSYETIKNFTDEMDSI